MNKFAACLEELKKVAYGPESMGKALKAFKAIQLKNPAIDQFMGGVGGKAGVKASLNSARRAGVPEEALQSAMPSIKEQFSHLRDGPTTFTTRRGDGASFLDRTGIGGALEGMVAAGLGGGDIKPGALSAVASSPSNRKALDAVLKGHELAETQVAPSNSFLAFGHRSPDVLLREHNMIQTLPAENAPVADLMRSMRAPGEAQALKTTTGFEFGKGPRISRHARKHLTNMHEQEAIRMVKEQGML